MAESGAQKLPFIRPMDNQNKSPATLLQDVEQLIYVIRGKRIILDSDLAHLYQVTTFNLNKSVTRNPERFPSDFMFILTKQELANLTFQTGIANSSRHGGRRTLPFAFTQEGVAMLSSVLRSERAIAVNIEIMRAFVNLKSLAANHSEISRRIDQLEVKYDGQFKAIFAAIRELMSNHAIPRKRIIGLDNQDK